jgi:hypothetical protein
LDLQKVRFDFLPKLPKRHSGKVEAVRDIVHVHFGDSLRLDKGADAGGQTFYQKESGAHVWPLQAGDEDLKI